MINWESRRHRSNLENKALSDQYILPTYGRFPLTFVSGKGAELYSADGQKYLDFFAGLAVDNLGHCHPQLVKALRDQASHLWHVSNVFTIQEQAELAEQLVLASGLSKAFFCNSGAEANEGAIKLVRYASLKQKGEGCFEILAFDRSFHGRTLGALSATMQEKYQSGFGPLVDGFKKVPFGDLDAFEKSITSKTCAVIAEPIQGEGGVRILPPEFWQKLRQICNDKGIYLILDEVQTGVGRTGKLFAYENFDIKPDLLTLAKGLGSGFPIGALVVNDNIAKEVHPGIHASTFGGNPLASRMGLETLSIVNQSAFLSEVVKKGDFFVRGLKKLKKEFSFIKDVRGIGLMVACEFNSDRASEIVQLSQNKGLLINAVQANTLRFVPPLIVTRPQIKQALAILREVLTELH